LEERLQTRLLYRTTRRVSLTDAGRALATQCRQLIQDRDAALATVGEEDGEVRGLLRMTCAAAYGERFIVPAIGDFALRHPGLSVQIELDDTVRDIVSEGIDLAIRFGQLADSRLIATRLASRTPRLVASPAYVAANGLPQAISDLSNHACVLGAADLWRLRDDTGGHSAEIAFRPNRVRPTRPLARDRNARRRRGLGGLPSCSTSAAEGPVGGPVAAEGSRRAIGSPSRHRAPPGS
jgi:DNA-binding transcriptional LysR family regulator